MDMSGSNDMRRCEESTDKKCEDSEDDTRQIKEDQVDRYTQNIELYNACRRFYVTRVQVADDIKAKLNKDLTTSGSESLDLSMEKLREEVVSLLMSVRVSVRACVSFAYLSMCASVGASE